MSDVTAQQVLSASAVKTAQFPLAFDSRLSIEVLQVIIGRLTWLHTLRRILFSQYRYEHGDCWPTPRTA